MNALLVRLKKFFRFSRANHPRRRVMAHFRDSVRRNAELYKRLAK